MRDMPKLPSNANSPPLCAYLEIHIANVLGVILAKMDPAYYVKALTNSVSGAYPELGQLLSDHNIAYRNVANGDEQRVVIAQVLEAIWTCVLNASQKKLKQHDGNWFKNLALMPGENVRGFIDRLIRQKEVLNWMYDDIASLYPRFDADVWDSFLVALDDCNDPEVKVEHALLKDNSMKTLRELQIRYKDKQLQSATRTAPKPAVKQVAIQLPIEDDDTEQPVYLAGPPSSLPPKQDKKSSASLRCSSLGSPRVPLMPPPVSPRTTSIGSSRTSSSATANSSTP